MIQRRFITYKSINWLKQLTKNYIIGYPNTEEHFWRSTKGCRDMYNLSILERKKTILNLKPNGGPKRTTMDAVSHQRAYYALLQREACGTCPLVRDCNWCNGCSDSETGHW